MGLATPRQNVCACVIFGYFRFACGVRYRLILLSALRCFKACCCESEPQMKEKRTTNTKRYVDNNLLQLLVLEMGLLEIISVWTSQWPPLLTSTVVADLFPFFFNLLTGPLQD